MSTEFVAAYLSIPADAEPHWETGYELIKRASADEKLYKKFAEAFEFVDPLVLKNKSDGKGKVLPTVEHFLDQCYT
ncbi:MAG: hypothetical protein QXI12_10485 [Candidatus Methanomethyliaceae archaeon]